jgi:hypothetical protein
LQFISLDNKFARASMVIQDGEEEGIAETVQAFIQSLNSGLKPIVTFHENYVRKGTIFEDGEVVCC